MNTYWETSRIIQALKRMQSSLSVSNAFEEQMCQIHRLIKNDTTALVVPIMDYHVEAVASTKFTIETKNATLNDVLKRWQTDLLNKNINIDIPRGLRELTTEQVRERLTSSLIGLRVRWELIDFGGNIGKWILPAKMWIMDGSSIYMKNNTDLGNREYYKKVYGTKYGSELLRNTDNDSIYIRRPFTPWYDTCTVPYLVRRGVLFNALFKQLILQKQASTLEELIPYLLLMTAGANKIAEAGADITEDEMKGFKDSLLKSINEGHLTGDIGKLIAVLNGDVKLEHFLPEFKKITDDSITGGVDSNILSGMGLIDIQGFGGTRKESIMNPQVFITDVLDSVQDWADLLRDVMLDMLDKNKSLHSNLANNTIRVVPGNTKAFLTDNMKRLIMLAHDKGTTDTESYLDDVFNRALEDVLSRRDKEKEEKVEERLAPRQTQVINKGIQPEKESKIDKEKQGKKKNTPEARNFKAEEKPFITLVYNTIDELPSSVKKVLSYTSQISFLKALNKSISEGKSEDASFEYAWSIIKLNHKLDDSGKWIKI